MKKITSILLLLLSFSIKAQYTGGNGDGHALDSLQPIVIVPAFTVNTHTICVGQSVTFTDQSTPGGATLNTVSNWNWVFPGGAISTSTLQNPSVTYTASGLYPVSLTAGLTGSCKTKSVTVNAYIYVSPGPAVVITATNVLCNGNANGIAIATGTGITGYTWSNGQITPTVSGLIAGNYTVIVTDGLCTRNATVQITQPAPLNVAINSSTNNVCAGSLINLNSFAMGGTAPYGFTWTPGPIGNAFAVTQTVAGTYAYVVNCIDKNGCVANAGINLGFNPVPTIAVNSMTVCNGDNVSLTASGAGSYVWIPGNKNGSTYTTTGTSNLFLTVIGTLNGCSSQATSTVIVNALPVPQITNSNNKGCVPLCMTFTATNNTSIQTCNWVFGDGSFASNTSTTNRCFSTAGEFTVKAVVTDNNGCINSVTVNLEAYPIPVADFNYGPIKPLVNEEVIFTDASYNAPIKTWDWYFKNTAKPHSNEQHPTYIYTDAGEYVVALVVKSNHGCADTALKTIVVGEDYGIFVPNTFTPNGDGLNDVFQPKGFGITKYEMQVFDRWGEQIFETAEFTEGWNGNYKDKGNTVVQEGVYVWRITLTNVFGKAHELTGNITLIK